MIEQVHEQDLVEMVNKLTDALDEVLTVGNWDTSLFLRASASRLKELRDQVKNLCSDDESSEVAAVFEQTDEDASRQIKVFVLLYQLEVDNLQKWFGAIEALTEYGMTRPAYQDEANIQEFIRSKESGASKNAYVIVRVNEDDVVGQESAQQDSLGHPLLTLKEGAIKLENIADFIHGNEKYKIKDGKLELIN